MPSAIAGRLRGERQAAYDVFVSMEPIRGQVLTNDPELDVLIEALLDAGRKRVTEGEHIFAVIMVLKADGEITHSGVYFMRSVDWFEKVMALEDAGKGLMRDGTARAVGGCVNLAQPGEYVPNEIPVLAVKVEHARGDVVHVRQHYRILRDGTIHYDDARVVDRANPKEQLSS